VINFYFRFPKVADYCRRCVLHNGVGDALQTIGLSFMHQDRLGSSLVITDKLGTILPADSAQAEFRSFKAAKPILARYAYGFT